MGSTFFLGALLFLVVVAGVVVFWPRAPRRRDSTFRDHTEFKYDDCSYTQSHDSSSHDGTHHP